MGGPFQMLVRFQRSLEGEFAKDGREGNWLFEGSLLQQIGDLLSTQCLLGHPQPLSQPPRVHSPVGRQATLA